jgi:hypothetical protein
MFRVRCQVKTDGAQTQVQIQGNARAGDIIPEGHSVTFTVTNATGTSMPAPSTAFSGGSASTDWDTSPDPGDGATFVAGNFVVEDDVITVTALVPATVDGEGDQSVSNTATCVEKAGGQFKQDTKNVCTLKKFNRGKCKSGDVLPDGAIQP